LLHAGEKGTEKLVAEIVVARADGWRVSTCPFQVNGSLLPEENKKRTHSILKSFFFLPRSLAMLPLLTYVILERRTSRQPNNGEREKKGKNEFAVIFLMEFLCGTRGWEKGHIHTVSFFALIPEILHFWIRVAAAAHR
jgi:hypothetical protein